KVLLALPALHYVLARRNVAALPRPVGVEELAAWLVHSLVSVSAEVIALGLEQVGGQPLAAIAVVERQRRGERRDGNARLDGPGHHVPPGRLAALDDAAEVPIEQQIAQAGTGVVGCLDLAQKRRADDAAG